MDECLQTQIDNITARLTLDMHERARYPRGECNTLREQIGYMEDYRGILVERLNNLKKYQKIDWAHNHEECIFNSIPYILKSSCKNSKDCGNKWYCFIPLYPDLHIKFYSNKEDAISNIKWYITNKLKIPNCPHPKYTLNESMHIMETTALYRIEALRDFGDVKAGDHGGFVESESNLSHTGDCWIYNDARAVGNSMVYDNARILDCAFVDNYAKIFGNAKIFDNAKIFGDARVFDNAKIFDNVKIFGDARVFGDAKLIDNTTVGGSASIYSGSYLGQSNLTL